MSQVEPKAKDSAGTASNGQDSGPGKECGKGSPTPTLTNSRGITVPAIRMPNGGLLAPANRLGDTNPNAGRPKAITREALIEASGEAAEDYRNLRNSWLDLAKTHLEAGDIDKADRCQKAADRIQDRYERYGLGSKQEVTVGDERLFEFFRDAMEDAGLDPETRLSVLARVQERIKPR